MFFSVGITLVFLASWSYVLFVERARISKWQILLKFLIVTGWFAGTLLMVISIIHFSWVNLP